MGAENQADLADLGAGVGGGGGGVLSAPGALGAFARRVGVAQE